MLYYAGDGFVEENRAGIPREDLALSEKQMHRSSNSEAKTATSTKCLAGADETLSLAHRCSHGLLGRRSRTEPPG